MKKIIKLVPVMALCAALGFHLSAEAKLKTESIQANQEWLLNPGGDPTNPAHYSPAPPGTKDDCEGMSEVCVVEAPANASSQPNFGAISGLQQALERGEPHDNITLAPYNPSL